MKLAFISTMAGVPWGGSEVLWFETAKVALHKNIEVLTSTFIYDPVPSPIQELAASGAITNFRPGYNPSLPVRLLRRVRNSIVKKSAEIKVLETFDPDRILLNQGGGYDILFRKDLQQYLLETTKPYNIICHNYNEDLIFSEQDRKLLIKLYSKAKCVFMICKPQADTIQKQLVCRLQNIKLVDNPINLKKIGLIAFPPLEEVQFASVASFDIDRKGQDIILEALSDKKWKNRKWQLNFYGSGKGQQYLEQLVNYYGLDEKVVFKGHVNDINFIWEKNHILLLSSRIETGPMVLTEAMLCGRASVATRVGRVNDLLKEGYNGFIAPAATVSLFDEALERAWKQQDKWEAMGRNAYETALANLDLNASETFFNLLTDTIKSSKKYQS